MQHLSRNLFLFESTCNVYLIRNGDAAILIDFGDGSVLNVVAELGIRRVSAILMTHHHRDQGQGLPRAVEAGIPIWVPETESELFSEVDWYWQARNIYNNYNVREDRFSLLHSVPVAGFLTDYSQQSFSGVGFKVLPTPGHTPGSISIIAEVDGRQVGFVGDLIMSPGRLWSLAATQWTYNGAEGVAYSALSLLQIKELALDALLPSHGMVILEPAKAIDALVDPLLDLLNDRGEHRSLRERTKNPFKKITPHVFRNLTSVANSYVVVSNSGKAIIIDYGYDFIGGFPDGTGRTSRRPWLYNLPLMKKNLGVNHVDVALPTHYHDDHVAGMNLLQRVEHTSIWAPENFAPILTDPSNYNLPCLWFDPIKVDVIQPLHTKIGWEEFSLTLYPLPGHTRFAVAILLEADQKRILFTGDEFQGDGGQEWNYVYQNRYEMNDYRSAAELYELLKPDIILPGHWSALYPDEAYFQQLKERADRLVSYHESILPLQEVFPGVEGFIARLTPYQKEVEPGENFTYQCEVANPTPSSQKIAVRLVVPENWAAEPGICETELSPGQVAMLDFHVYIPANADPVRRERIAVDLFLGEHHFGQQAEALVTVTKRL